MLVADVAEFGADFDLFEDADDLRFTKSGFLHAETSVGWILNFEVAWRIEEASIERQLNERPSKTLGFRTPAEMFSACVALTG